MLRNYLSNLFRDSNLFLALFKHVLQPVIQRLATKPLTADDILPPHHFDQYKTGLFLSNPLFPKLLINRNLIVDESEGAGDIFTQIPYSSYLLYVSRLLPFNDTDYFQQDDDPMVMFKSLLKEVSANIQIPPKVYSAMDDYLHTLITHGPLALLVKDKCIDLSFLSQFEVREGFSNYGATLYLGKDFSPKEICWCHKQDSLYYLRRSVVGDVNWELASRIFRTSYVFWSTIMHHLIRTHLLYGGTLFTAVMQFLPPAHPLRLFLTPFHFRTARINLEATELLTPVNGVFHRVTGLSEVGMKDILSYAYEEAFKDIDSALASQEVSRLPFIEDAITLRDALEHIVSRAVAICYQSDGEIASDYELLSMLTFIETELRLPTVKTPTKKYLISLLTKFLFTVTAHHHWFGDVVGLLANPYFASLSIPKENSLPSKSQTTMTWLLAIFVSLPMPKLVSRFKHAESDSVLDNFFKTEYLETLADCQHIINMRNDVRDVVCTWSSPQELECSVSI